MEILEEMDNVRFIIVGFQEAMNVVLVFKEERFDIIIGDIL